MLWNKIFNEICVIRMMQGDMCNMKERKAETKEVDCKIQIATDVEMCSEN